MLYQSSKEEQHAWSVNQYLKSLYYPDSNIMSMYADVCLGVCMSLCVRERERKCKNEWTTNVTMKKKKFKDWFLFCVSSFVLSFLFILFCRRGPRSYLYHLINSCIQVGIQKPHFLPRKQIPVDPYTKEDVNIWLCACVNIDTSCLRINMHVRVE